MKIVTPRKLWQVIVSTLVFICTRGCFSSLPKVVRLVPRISVEGKIKIGRRCILRSFHSRQFITVMKGALLEIGDDAFINNSVRICAAVEIKIGNNVRIGDMTSIVDTDFHAVSPESPTKTKPISIGDNVWIAANCMILAGSVIGDHAVIAAGSIVRGDIPPRCVAAGIPAKVKQIFEVPDGWIRA